MRTKTVNIYKFNELSEDVQDKIIERFSQSVYENDGYFIFEGICDDAKDIGLEIESLDQHRPNEGSFIGLAIETAEKILANHGPDCNTYKAAQEFKEQYSKLRDENELNQENDTRLLEIEDAVEVLESDFLHDLLECYRIMLEKEVEYQTSREVIVENIEANEYEFTEDGKIA